MQTQGSNYLEECASPESDEDFWTIAKKTLNKLVELNQEEGGWKEISQEENSFLYEKKLKNDSLFTCLKTTSIIERSPKNLINYIWQCDLKARQKWDPELLEMKILQQISEDLQVVQRKYRAPSSLIAPRDFVAINGRWQSPTGEMYIYGSSINHKEDRVTSNYVRGYVMVTGFIFSPIEGDQNSCRCTRILQLDPKGMIPAWIVNAGKKRSLQSHLIMKRIMEEILPKEEQESNQIISIPKQIEDSSNQTVPISDQKDQEEKSIKEKETSSNKIAVSQIVSPEVEKLLSSIQQSLEEINGSISQSNKRIKAVENLIQSGRSGTSGFSDEFIEKYDSMMKRDLKKTNVFGLISMGFAICWPFVC